MIVRKKIFIALGILVVTCGTSNAQQMLTDSIKVRVMPSYDSVGRFHRRLFGENYRKEYNMETTVPVLRLSSLHGGLKVLQRGGGNQTRSLRLVDPTGKEWVLRSIEKYPEVLLPLPLRQTFVRDIIKDNMSAQHPFSALVVPVLAKAAGIPFAQPVIGWVAEDPALGSYSAEFARTICLLEEREPLGKSDNTAKMNERMNKDPRYRIDAEMLTRIRALDLLMGDWDRHDDQWRWHPQSEKGGKVRYIPVPRDRDQVFYRSDGWIQRIAQSSWLLPMMQGYEREMRKPDWFFWEGREIYARGSSFLTEKDWERISRELCQSITDSVFEEALKKLPEPGYTLRHAELMEQFRSRRAALPADMMGYYRFFNRIVDIVLSDKSERLELNSQLAGKLVLRVYQDGHSDTLERIFDPAITKEIRIYQLSGDDTIAAKLGKSPIRLRIIAGQGTKKYDLSGEKSLVRLYGPDKSNISGEAKVKVYSRQDSLNSIYTPKDLYSRQLVYPMIGYNIDDGLMIGGGLRFTSPGFRKKPYASMHSLSALYAADTHAIRLGYNGQWPALWENTDLLIAATILAPNNTRNYFGSGNSSLFDSERDIRYYRARFNLLQLDPALKWGNDKLSFTLGPSFQYYSLKRGENSGRLIDEDIEASGREFIDREKVFAGVRSSIVWDTRDKPLLASKGSLLNVDLLFYKGLNRYSSTIAQLSAAFECFIPLAGNRVVLLERIGGGLTAGRPAFYQYHYLGGQGNLNGFRQFRFAGEHMLYNNMELRIKIEDMASYVLPGQIGLLGLYDLGRVWARGDHGGELHHGIGAGAYFAPASMFMIRAVAGYSREGLYPSLALRLNY